MYKTKEDKDKIEQVTQESSDIKANKTIEYISQESVPLADYTYGIDQEALNYNVALRDTPNIRRSMFLS